jgi:hypothetical protein
MIPVLLLSAALGAAAPDWSALADLHGASVPPPAAPSVVVVVTARGARDLRAWEERLRRLQPSPPVLRVVDVPPGGQPLEVARRLARRVPAGVSIALDARRTVAGSLGLDTGRPNVLVIGRQGRVVARVRGKADDRRGASVAAAWRAATREDGPR